VGKIMKAIPLIIVTLVLLISCDKKSVEQYSAIDNKCWNEKEVFVRGMSMYGVLNDGDKLTLKNGYYNCNSVNFKDIVIFEYNSQKDFVKQVYGMPGDKLGYNKNGFLLINNKKIKNTKGDFYKVDKIGKSYIRLIYQIAKNKIIPKGHYFVLGTTPIKGYDSRRIGLVSLSNIIGKVDTKTMVEF
jgi:signal peptidase I